MYECMYVCMSMCVYLCMYVFVYVCMYVSMYVRLYFSYSSNRWKARVLLLLLSPPPWMSKVCMDGGMDGGICFCMLIYVCMYVGVYADGSASSVTYLLDKVRKNKRQRGKFLLLCVCIKFRTRFFQLPLS